MSVLRCCTGDVEINDILSVPDFVFRNIQQHETKTAIIDDATGEQITYGALQQKIDTLASVLYSRGVRKNDVICLFSGKCIIHSVAIFAILKLGAIMTPGIQSHTSRELATQLNHSKSKMIITDKKLMGTTVAAVKHAPNVESKDPFTHTASGSTQRQLSVKFPLTPCKSRHYDVFVDHQRVKNVFSVDHVEGYECLEDMIRDSDKSLPDIQIDPAEDTAVVIYSSGTTGLPKGVALTHYNLVTIITILSLREYARGDIWFQNSAQLHIDGLSCTLCHLFNKRTLVLYTPASAILFLHKAKQYQVKNILMYPHHLAELMKLSTEEINEVGLDFAEITLLTWGSIFNAASTKELLRKIKVKAIVQGYGSTEAYCISFDDPKCFVPGSAGLVSPNVQLKVVDLNSGKTLGPNEKGEIVVRAPFVTSGYFNNSEATKKAFDADGWFHMGDIGYYDETGHIFIVQRRKDVMKVKGLQVFPSEIEEVIYTHPAVKSVCVVGVDGDTGSSIPMACVIIKDGHNVTEEEIMELVDCNLADYKRLKGGVKFLKEFPMTGHGKIIRRQLTDMVNAQLKKDV